MSVSTIIMTQINTELGTALVQDDIVLIASLMIILFVSSRLMVETMDAIKRLVLPIAAAAKIRSSKQKRILARMAEVARYERETKINK